MAPRLELHEKLVAVLGSRSVYFQPTDDIHMVYPCIVYSRGKKKTDFANNLPYRHLKSYEVTVIDRDPDSEIPDKLAEFPMTAFDRHFVADQLNHDVFNISF